MKLTSLVFALLSIASVTIAVPSTDKDKENYVQSNKLRRLLTRSALQKHAAKLQQFANQDPDKNRAFGGKGHQATVDWLYETFKKYPDYYTVEKQEFVYEYAYGTSIFSAEGESYDSQYFTYSPSTNGLFEGELAATNNLGCEEVNQSIALTS